MRPSRGVWEVEERIEGGLFLDLAMTGDDAEPS